VLALVLAVIWVRSELHPDDENNPLPIEAVRINFGGGGGTPGGKDTGPGTTGPGDDTGSETGDGSENNKDKAPPPEVAPIPVAKQEGIRTEFANDQAATRYFKRGSEAFNSLTRMESEARTSLRKSINPGVKGNGKGKGGSGRDGGKDTGRDKGQGGGQGEGRGATNVREKRVLRWAMTFNTQNGEDYRSQLIGLGAMIGVPRPDGQFLLIRDLANPASGKVEDIRELDRIYWIDDKPDSVRSLFGALRMPPPNEFVAFFPKRVEDRLLDLELAWMQKHYGKRNENLIHETKFDVIRSGNGYDVRVRNVALRR
jgi:hypothetical protein